MDKAKIKEAFKDVTPEQKIKLVEECGISMGYMYQITSAAKPAGPKVAKAFERILEQEGLAAILRPDLF